MKKRMATIMAGVVLAGAMFTGCGNKETTQSQPATTESEQKAVTEAETTAFKATNTINFNVCSSAGGNSDLFSRTIADICTKEDLVEPPFVVTNKIDGSGNIIRMETRDSSDPDHTLLCFNAGDVKFTLDSNVGLTMEDFAPIAVLAADKQLLFAKAGGDYTSFEEVVKKLDEGAKLNVGGTPTNEQETFTELADKMGKADSFNYLKYDSSNEALTALLGDHLDLAMSSPGSAIAYVESGDIVPIAAFSDEHFAAPLDVAPTTEELGYGVIQNPMWRGVIASKNMSPEAQEYWNETLKKVSETDAWKEYLDKTLLSPYYHDLDGTREIFKDTEDAYYASLEEETEKE